MRSLFSLLSRNKPSNENREKIEVKTSQVRTPYDEFLDRLRHRKYEEIFAQDYATIVKFIQQAANQNKESPDPSIEYSLRDFALDIDFLSDIDNKISDAIKYIAIMIEIGEHAYFANAARIATFLDLMSKKLIEEDKISILTQTDLRNKHHKIVQFLQRGSKHSNIIAIAINKEFKDMSSLAASLVNIAFVERALYSLQESNNNNSFLKIKITKYKDSLNEALSAATLVKTIFQTSRVFVRHPQTYELLTEDDITKLIEDIKTLISKIHCDGTLNIDHAIVLANSGKIDLAKDYFIKLGENKRFDLAKILVHGISNKDDKKIFVKNFIEGCKNGKGRVPIWLSNITKL